MQVSLRSMLLCCLIALAACNGGGANVVRGQDGGNATLTVPAAALSRTTQLASNASATGERLIDAGGGAVGSWSSDEDYSGGWSAVVSSAIDLSRVTNPAPQAVYQSQRTGAAFSYTIGNLVAGGAYNVRLHFAESFFRSAGARLFGVALNGAQVLSNFDIYSAAGGQNIAVVRTFSARADSTGRIAIAFRAAANNASVAGIEVSGGGGSATPAPAPAPTSVQSTAACAPYNADPVFSGCFRAKSPYHDTVASLIAKGAKIHNDATASNYWNNGNPLNDDNINANGSHANKMWQSSSSDPQYTVTCQAYGTCDAATSVTGSKIHIPRGAAPTSDSDHHIFIFDPSGGQEIDMWGGYASNEACQVGTFIGGVLTCSWGGAFSFAGNGLAAVVGNSGIAGGVAYGLAAITAGDILSGHIKHALGLIGPCLDDNGQYPSTPGRSTDSGCAGHAANGGNGAEPTLRYGDMLHLKSSVNLNAAPYSGYSSYCKVVVRALQEYGAYADDNASNWGLHLITVDETNPGWQTIMASMIAGGDASGSASAANWPSCLNRIRAGDLETITLNQGGNSALP